MIHKGKGFSIVNEAEVDVFLEFPCFLYKPTIVGNLISGFSAFSKLSLCIWKFLVHALLKPNLKDFEHYLTSMWNECSCMVVCTFSVPGTQLWTFVWGNLFSKHCSRWAVSASLRNLSVSKLCSPNTDLLRQKFWGWGQAVCVFLSPPAVLIMLKFENHCYRRNRRHKRKRHKHLSIYME